MVRDVYEILSTCIGIALALIHGVETDLGRSVDGL